MNPERRAFLVKERARELGFHSCGVTDLSPTPHSRQLTEWLERDMAGTMTYMHRQKRRRLEPTLIVRGATRAVAVTRNYYVPDTAVAPGQGRVAKYARGRDYHESLRRPLDELALLIGTLSGSDAVVRTFLDSGPVPERELGQRAGLGWIGKNTMLIDPTAGSFFFIGSILTNADLAVDLPFESDRCGTCRKCLDACPTGAFPQERVLDSRLCISYLTIEHRGDIPDPLAGRMENWVFGCDVCQDVCPWNQKFAQHANDPALEQEAELATIDLREMSEITNEQFEDRYGWTALERPAAAGMRRNAMIATTNARKTQTCLNQ